MNQLKSKNGMIQKAIPVQQIKNPNQMTGFLKKRMLLCQARVLVRRGRWLLGNFALFSIIEKLWVPGVLVVLHSLQGYDYPNLGPGSDQEVFRQSLW